jgi:hypothetical protein
MPSTANSEKILRRFKGLRAQLQEGEVPRFTVPAIWEGGQGKRPTPCDVIVTNRRVFGYYYVSFPRERLFLDAIALEDIRAVSLREKSFEPMFRELLIKAGTRKVYVRAPRQKIEGLYEALRAEREEAMPISAKAGEQSESQAFPAVFGRQEVRGAFEGSPLAITLLFVGGLALEIVGALVWMLARSLQTGLPLIFAGLVAVVTAILVVRQRRM